MKHVYNDIIQYRGNHDDYGVYQGNLLKHSPIMADRKKQWASLKERHFIIDHQTIKNLLHQFAPGIWDEFKGLAEALNMSLNEAIQEFGGYCYYVEYGHSGCSIYVTTNYLVRNYDNDPASYVGRYATIYQPTDNGYATIGPTMQNNRADGWNE